MDRKKKNLLTLLGLCAVLAVCIALYFIIPRGEDESSDTPETAKEITVDTINQDSIEKVEVSKKGKISYTLVKQGEEWKLSGQDKVPLDESKISSMFSCFSSVTATKTLEKTAQAMEEYGLEDPAYTICVTADGKVYRYDLGIQVPVEGGYYGVSSSDSKSIYCLSEKLVSELFIDSKILIARDEIDQMDSDNMVYLHVDNQSGSDFEASAAKEKDRVDSYSRWNITKPYDKPLAASLKDWNTILGYFNSLTFGNLVEYGAKNLGKYGLDSPSSEITIRYFETTPDYEPEADTSSGTSSDGDQTEEEVPEKYRKYHTVKLSIGNKTGKSYYACLKGSAHVYLMNGDVVEKMTKLNVFDAMNHCVYATLATKLKGYEAIYGDTKLSVTRTPLEKTENGNNNQNLWRLNGKEISAENESEFLTPYSSAYLLEYTQRADDSVKPKSKNAVLTMVFHEEKRDVTVTYYPYDGVNFYRVDRDGMDYFLVDKRSVDDVIKNFKKIEKFGD